MRRIFLLLLAALFLFSFSSTTPAVKSDIVMLSKKSGLKGGLTRSNFQDSVRTLYDHLQLEKAGLAFEVFNLGMVGYHNLKYQGKLGDKNLLTIIDFTKPSTKKRFYTIDLDHGTLKYHTYVAHGRNTGENEAKKFSNIPHSNQSSLGFYVTGETYVGSKGYSLRLDGTESKYNGNLRSRAVVVHDAEYVSESWIKRYGRLGRSQGCPALPKELAKPIINTIKNKTAVFAYYNDEQYVKSSEYLSVESLMKKLEIQESFTQQPAVAAE